MSRADYNEFVEQLRTFFEAGGTAVEALSAIEGAKDLADAAAVLEFGASLIEARK